MTLAECAEERERAPFLQLCFWREGVFVREWCMENECLKCMYLPNTKEQGMIVNQPLSHGAGVLIFTKQVHDCQGVHWKGPSKALSASVPPANGLTVSNSFFY